jgi:hypothetical protein
MSRTRKTIDIETLKASVNDALANADYQDREMGAACARVYRQGIAGVLESALHTTGNYNGFRYADPNAEYDDQGIVEGTYDDTRRNYF